jgi:hypothetical protein
VHFYFLLFQGISFLVVGLDLIGEQVSWDLDWWVYGHPNGPVWEIWSVEVGQSFSHFSCDAASFKWHK